MDNIFESIKLMFKPKNQMAKTKMKTCSVSGSLLQLQKTFMLTVTLLTDYIRIISKSITSEELTEYQSVK